MDKRDTNGTRTVQDLIRRYSQVLGMKKNVESNSASITKLSNELNLIFNSILINLENYINQSEVSLWFYSGTPTANNLPYTSWETPSDHYGDLYYDQANGKAYQYTEIKGWEQKIDANLLQALAITNSETDTSEDHERIINFEEPAVPYSSGDWYIQSDGNLRICQLSRTEGIYDVNDWINANDYTSSLATKIDDVIEVLKGSIVLINDNFAKFTDLATGGSTIIDGSNIKTGTIDANLVTIANNLVQLGNFGIKLGTGATIIGDDGLKNTYPFFKTGNVGFMWNLSDNTTIKENIFVDIIIPDNFVISKAIVKMIHSPCYWSVTNPNTGVASYTWGYCKNIKLYKCTNINSRLVCADFGGGVWDNDDLSNYSEITSAFGTDGFTASIPSNTSYDAEIVDSTDIKNNLGIGLNRLKIESSTTSPTTQIGAAAATGGLQVLVEVEGFIKYVEE